MSRPLLYWAGALALGVAAAAPATAQTTPASTDSLNFDAFGDADSKSAQAYATQKVLFLSPTKLISVGYEAQTGFDLTSRPAGEQATGATTQAVDHYRGMRLGVNAPVISRSNFILNLGLTYWNTGVSLSNPNASAQHQALNRGLRTTGLNATVFKPFNEKHYLLLQANGDLNGNYRRFDDLNNKALTYSGTAIYGWKPTDSFMWGLGVTRTYRAGQLLHIPVVLYNRTFNPRWGVEAVFPARVNVRRSFGTSSLLMLGYELEGNAYYLGPVNGQDLYLRRGEMKPRITYERQLAGFVWLSAQAGYRYNWRFDSFRTQNPSGDDKPVFENDLQNPFYFNVSLNLVSP
ncbi:hypothetical protein SAMN02745146_3691 [Hymenobacter daecheongensis DSM 21074]|uniref:DUF6268 domain-containing protein n=1 Tax=Hymenobacter daecheongensis DSM 21074 TaxID=1121955 RepID=A0A1M6LAU2_9BACT|nr:DUF6268 family outer membrane beta-barrel protein [Hymenobacter daecheongensis]SHJ68321.1 hypothetical protein SAMN02745146_3691 [Hymenobacter daecheongensis DSM 21074]